MIILAMIKNKHYMQVIKKYFDDGGPFVVTNYKSEKDYKEFLKDVEIYNDFGFRQKGEHEHKQMLEQEIKENFINYLDNIDKNWKTPAFDYERIQKNKDHLLKQLTIRVTDLIYGSSKNRTWLYYIDIIRRYVIL